MKELDWALLEKRSHLSVHSLKDMPMETPEELPIETFSRRETPERMCRRRQKEKMRLIFPNRWAAPAREEFYS